LFDIAGRVYLVAGAGGGLGGPIAQELARRGARLALFDVDAEALSRIGETIPGAVCETADMRDEAAVSRLTALAREGSDAWMAASTLRASCRSRLRPSSTKPFSGIASTST
jgi:NAD(P)-dependent dehydrogenase (short-subunit alcohol dehydrogenase family)